MKTIFLVSVEYCIELKVPEPIAEMLSKAMVLGMVKWQVKKTPDELRGAQADIVIIDEIKEIL